MLRTLWYMLHVAALAALTAWILSWGGQVDMTAGDYRLRGETSVIVLLLVALLLAFLALYRLWLAGLNLPRAWARLRRERRLARGHAALLRAFSALAVGQDTQALHHAKRAQQLLPDFTGVPTLLVAAAAARQGNSTLAGESLRALLSTPARDLGVRGLVAEQIRRGDWGGGLHLARAALAQTPRDPLVARLVYDLECQMGDFTMALTRQKMLSRHGVLDEPQARHDRVMMHCALGSQAMAGGDLDAALKHYRAAQTLEPGFVPAACGLSDAWVARGKPQRAIAVLLAAATHDPHPEVIERYARLAPVNSKWNRRTAYFNRLRAACPRAVTVELLFARLAAADSLQAETDRYLRAALQIAPTVQVYRALAAQANCRGDVTAAQDYLLAATTALPDPVWHCRVTGQIYDRWQALTLPDHRFGTLTFGVPQTGSQMGLASSAPAAFFPQSAVA